MTQSDHLYALREPLGELLSRYHELLQAGIWRPEQVAQARHCAASLALGLASIERRSLRFDLPQVVVLGPTQVGKSTLSNALLGEELAGVSPLAGYTAHAQGFIAAEGPQDTLQQALASYFADYQRVEQREIQSSSTQSYCLESVAQAPLSSGFVLWDSPDFDSVSALNYWHSVIRLRALADVVVLVVSKDKYADQSVWDMLALSRELNTPTVVVINKLDQHSESLVVEAFKQRWQERLGEPPPRVIPVHYHSGSDLPLGVSESLREAVEQALAQESTDVASIGQFLRRHSPSWLAPLEREIAAERRWQLARDQALTELLERYRHGYQTNGEHYESLQLAVAKLLELLELPFIGSVMANARQVITWPVKAVLGWHRGGGEKPPVAPESAERELLLSLSRHCAERLQAQALGEAKQDAVMSAWWQAIAEGLQQREIELNAQRAVVIDQHIVAFSAQIDAAAHRLYDRLQTQPVLLNSLRAARVTTDAAAVVFTVKSGGMGFADLIFAPAMLSLTSMMTESTLGTYMKTVERDLQVAQRQSVQAHLVDGLLVPAWQRPLSHQALMSVFGFDQAWLRHCQQLLNQAEGSR